MRSALQSKVLQAIASISLAFTYLAIGFALCAGFPQITRNLSSEHSAFDASPYARDALVDAALATRAFTVDDDGRSDPSGDISRERLLRALLDSAEASIASPEKGAYWSDDAKAIIGAHSEDGASATETMDALYDIDPSYSLDSDALEHLDDVNEVISSVRMPLLGITLIAAFCLMSLVMMFGPRAAGRALLFGGCGALALFAVLGIWGIIGFDGLFTWMHSLFFADGSWTFPATSLLIEMYPEPFWIGMGLWWLGSSCVVALASIVIGLVIIKIKPAEEEPRQPAGLQA